VIPVQSFLSFFLLLPLPIFYFLVFMCSCIFRVSHSPSLCLNFIFYFLFSFYFCMSVPLLPSFPFFSHSISLSIFLSSFYLLFISSFFLGILHLSNSPPYCSILFSHSLCHSLSQSFSILFLCVFFYLSLSLILPFLLPVSFSNCILLSKFFSCIFFYCLLLTPTHSTFFFCFSSLFCVFFVSHSLSPSPKYFLFQFFLILIFVCFPVISSYLVLSMSPTLRLPIPFHLFYTKLFK
jgi:hypothetical protein